ncbi:hypothetical protein TRVL_03497 [Trypanosoma vivax]|nr:hypothetical protein TRVL_03497 [Trypanosoma vivax]
MHRSRLVWFSRTRAYLPQRSLLRRQCSGGTCGFSGSTPNNEALSRILAQAKGTSSGDSSTEFFDGRFVGGSPTMDPNMLRDMHRSLSQSLTPEMRESMRSMMESMQRGNGMPQMGMMAFGVGENERGKKVARGAKLTFDPNTGTFSKDFIEKQLEDDDCMLGKGTEDSSPAEEIEVMFEEDAKQHTEKGTETILESEVQVEEVHPGRSNDRKS